jgi:hypothetical protein
MPEMLPPLTLEDLRQSLGNPTFTVYVYIGSGIDKGWKVAKAAFDLLPALRIYLVKDGELVRELLGSRTGVRGIVFGFESKPKRFLNKAEADDLLVVVQTITAARRKGK